MKNTLIAVLISFILVSCLYDKGGIVDPLSTGTTGTNNENGTTGTTNNTAGTGTTGTSAGNTICDLVSGTAGTTGTSPQTNSSGEICFDTQVLPLIVSNCAVSGCHDSKSKSEGYELTSYATITKKGVSAGKPSSSKIYTVLSAKGESKMPPAPRASFTDAQKKLISDWISQGAKNTTCLTSGGTGGTIPDSVTISFANHIKPILNTYCVGCHGGLGASGGVQLDNYNSVKAVAASGQLYGSVAQISNNYVPMPTGGKLSDCQIQAIKIWVDKGYLNN